MSSADLKDGKDTVRTSRTSLATGVITAQSLRDLALITALYPDTIEAKVIDQLSTKLRSALLTVGKVVDLSELFQAIPIPEVREADAAIRFSVILTKFVIQKGNITAADAGSPEFRDIVHQVMEQSARECLSSIRDIAEQIDRVKLFDCLWPSPSVAPEFGSPGRVIAMVQRYWILLRRLLVHHVTAYVIFRPHPLRLMLTSMSRRFAAAMGQIRDVSAHRDEPDIIESLIDILIEADPDAIHVLKDWIYQNLDTIDRWIECLRQKTGIDIIELTFAESAFCEYSEKAIAEYTERVEKEWSAIKTSTKKGSNATTTAQTTPDTTASTTASLILKDLGTTKKLLLRAVLKLGAIEKTKFVYGWKIAKFMGINADSRFRGEISDLRPLKLLGGDKGSQGYWLTPIGLECARILAKSNESTRQCCGQT
jgi:hypothetical protein